jgi:transcriptional regulator with XRE-family HTH domain
MVGGSRQLDPDHDLYDWAAVELRRQRQARDTSAQEVADLIGKDRSLISKIETGESRLQEKDADAIDLAWDLGGLFGRIVRLAKTRHSAEWGAARAELEATASHIRSWSLGWITPLLQTEDYARASFIGARRLDVEQAVTDRMKRQERLIRASPPAIWALFDQTALEHPIGGPAVQRAQLARLIELEASPTHTIRVVPRSAGAYVGRDGPFVLYTSHGKDTVFTETLGPGRLIQDASEVGSYRVWYDQIGDVALPKSSSMSLIREILEAIK